MTEEETIRVRLLAEEAMRAVGETVCRLAAEEPPDGDKVATFVVAAVGSFLFATCISFEMDPRRVVAAVLEEIKESTLSLQAAASKAGSS